MKGINEKGLMGGQLYYRGFAEYAKDCRAGTQPLQPPFLVFHMLAQCAFCRGSGPLSSG